MILEGWFLSQDSLLGDGNTPSLHRYVYTSITPCYL